MATYLYGLVLDRNTHLVPAHVTGVGGAAVRVLECDGLGALVSTVDAAPRSANIDDVRAHDHALQAVVHHGATVASVRFGQTFPGDDDARRHVRERAVRVAGLLAERDGCVEMRLLMTHEGSQRSALGREPQAEGREPVGPGTAYLERLRSGGEHVRGLSLRDVLGPVVLAERVEEIAPALGAAFSHLIRRADESVYRDAIAALPSLGDARLVGPLAFYSFAETME